MHTSFNTPWTENMLFFGTEKPECILVYVTVMHNEMVCMRFLYHATCILWKTYFYSLEVNVRKDVCLVLMQQSMKTCNKEKCVWAYITVSAETKTN